MPRKLEEITATYQHERFRFENGDGDVVIGEAALVDNDEGPKRITIKVKEEDEEPKRHLTYRLYGAWTSYTNKRTGVSERQFQVKTFVRCEPHGRAGVIAYLSQAPNIGRVIGGRLFAKFGGNAVKIVREQPDVAAAAVERLSVSGAEEAAEWLEREKNLEDCTIDLVDLLDGRGFPKQVTKQAVKEFGNRAAQIIRQNPYRLMQFRGCGFKRADSLYLDLEHPPAALKRQALCAWHTLAQRTSGDTWHYVEVARRGLAGSIGGADVKADKAIRLAVRGEILACTYTDGINGPPDWDGSATWLAEERKARNERRLAKLVAEVMRDNVEWPELPKQIHLTSHQRTNLEACILSPLGILGGSPGTGKTYTAAQFIGQLVEVFGADQIGVGAPTGKAAVRLSEALDEYGLPLRAKTWHSLLGVENADDGSGWSFAHNATNPLPFKVLIGDESSMLDTDLMASIFAARATGTLVLLIGDVNQLPPVGHGAPLRDMIAAGIPYGELREIHRNEGGIVQACADIRDGKRFGCDGNLRSTPDQQPEDQIERMWDIINDVSREEVLDPVWDFQVLCAVNKKSPLSRRELNKVLQARLNPNPAINGSAFRLDDKVVNTKNGWFPEATDWLHKHGEPTADDATRNGDDKLYVANGELGRVVVVEKKYLVVTLGAPKRAVIVPRGAAEEDSDSEESTGTGCNWDLGYALSVHKFQGSEIPVAIIMVDESAGAARVCDRSWWYTAFSRAKKTCYVVGKIGVVYGHCKRLSIKNRKTFLKELIAEEAAND